MSDVMNCMSFPKLLNWILTEYRQQQTIFGVHKQYKANSNTIQFLFGRKLETVIGPAAGPNSQLAQNIIAAYFAGGRFFELKTVQKMDGAELAACVNKPCINVSDEGYNCEWSTELTVPEAQDEYIKAWFLLSVISKEFALGAMDGFQFNISVGYDLAGIQTSKIDTFINHMMEAGDTPCFRECREFLLANTSLFQKVTAKDIEGISSKICNSVTISTLHGCPPKEIESIASYLITQKKLHTFIKCNPTLLGYDYARKTMDEMGYDYVAFGRFHFEDDLQLQDAVPMLQRLQHLADTEGLEFGVKLTNTFPVDVKAGELPSEEMYMSGKALYVLSLSVARLLSRAFDGKLRIAYSGGADYFNIEKITGCEIWPVTVATTILKPGGYNRLHQMASTLQDKGVNPFEQVSDILLEHIIKEAKTDKHYTKTLKIPKSRKSTYKVPLTGCFTAPCENTCPIHQDIVTYMKLAKEGRMEEAFSVILDKNALPFITGTICAHGCMGACTRNFYETPVRIRDAKLKAAMAGYEAGVSQLKVTGSCNKKVAVIGGGPAGMAAAFYLARAGVKVTIFEKKEALGGVVRFVIPEFRIGEDRIQKDVSFLQKLGVTIYLNHPITNPEECRKDGFDAVVLAVGAGKAGTLSLQQGKACNAISFLAENKKTKGQMNLGRQVVVIGGGNTAMDTARAALRTSGVEKVSIVYRRTARYMPADEEELLITMREGVLFEELLAPVSYENHILQCKRTVLGEPDASGRQSVVETEEIVNLPADTVIAAVGEKVSSEFYVSCGLEVDEKGFAKTDSTTLQSSIPYVYVIGDGLHGPATVVKAMANAMTAAEAIIGSSVTSYQARELEQDQLYHKKGILAEPNTAGCDADRCLGCSNVCENCVDVCPNRANISIAIPGVRMHFILHLDDLCNECGNCNSFCPYRGAPYQDKFTLFSSEDTMKDSRNDGFTVLDRVEVKARVRYQGSEFVYKMGDKTTLDDMLQKMIQTVCRDYSYLL